MRLVIAVLLIVHAGCLSSPVAPSPDGTATVQFGETVALGQLRVSFADIVDSRCPTEVVCAWDGDAAVRLESGAESIVLHTNQTVGPATGKLSGVTMTLLEVKPRPVTPDGTKKADYVATIRFSQ